MSLLDRLRQKFISDEKQNVRVYPAGIQDARNQGSSTADKEQMLEN